MVDENNWSYLIFNIILKHTGAQKAFMGTVGKSVFEKKNEKASL